jgi:hypothetical protein
MKGVVYAVVGVPYVLVPVNGSTLALKANDETINEIEKRRMKTQTYIVRGTSTR